MYEPTRQIHLDFHTSEHIPAIGADFDKKQFQEALKLGRVNLINLFAKCHHSWSYYPTKIGMVHPHLVCKDLLGEQIEACHEIGVKAPVYYTMGWSANDAEMHPEWCVRRRDGSIEVSGDPWPEPFTPDAPKPTFHWKELCPTGEYHRLMMAQTEEILDNYEVDGLWYDIYHAQKPCWCPNCLKEMLKRNVNIDDVDQVLKYRAESLNKHMKDLRKLILSRRPDASIYFNGLTALERKENLLYRPYANNTKNDLEDLPTTWGGYDKFPVRSKVFLRENKPITAMSGKFHTAWGEFGGFKDPEAIRYEAASMIAYGARCNFGDQLHPAGRMDMTTYANIGHAYRYVEKIEEYGVDAVPCADLGLLISNDADADEGLAKILLEEQLDFDVILPGDDLSRFDTVVVPSLPGILDDKKDAFEGYLSQGGKALILGRGILKADCQSVTISRGASYGGEALYDRDYTLAREALRESAQKTLTAKTRLTDLPQTPFLNFTGGLRFTLGEGAESLADLYEPWFSRTWGKYCGHQYTANKTETSAHPAVWQKGGLIATAHDLDRMYHANGAKVHRTLTRTLLNRLHTAPMAEAALPSAGRISLLSQPDKGRYVLHLLYAMPVQRGNCSVIEDLPELRDVEVVLRLPEKPRKLTLVPDGGELPFREETSDRKGLFQVRAVIPAFSCHGAVVCRV